MAASRPLVLAAVVLFAGRMGSRPLPMVAYTVELTDPSALGGRAPPGAPGADLSGGPAVPPAPEPKGEPAAPAPPPEPEPPKPALPAKPAPKAREPAKAKPEPEKAAPPKTAETKSGSPSGGAE